MEKRNNRVNRKLVGLFMATILITVSFVSVANVVACDCELKSAPTKTSTPVNPFTLIFRYPFFKNIKPGIYPVPLFPYTFDPLTSVQGTWDYLFDAPFDDQSSFGYLQTQDQIEYSGYNNWGEGFTLVVHERSETYDMSDIDPATIDPDIYQLYLEHNVEFALITGGLTTNQPKSVVVAGYLIDHTIPGDERVTQFAPIMGFPPSLLPDILIPVEPTAVPPSSMSDNPSYPDTGDSQPPSGSGGSDPCPNGPDCSNCDYACRARAEEKYKNATRDADDDYADDMAVIDDALKLCLGVTALALFAVFVLCAGAATFSGLLCGPAFGKCMLKLGGIVLTVLLASCATNYLNGWYQAVSRQKFNIAKALRQFLLDEAACGCACCHVY